MISGVPYCDFYLSIVGTQTGWTSAPSLYWDDWSMNFSSTTAFVNSVSSFYILASFYLMGSSGGFSSVWMGSNSRDKTFTRCGVTLVSSTSKFGSCSSIIYTEFFSSLIRQELVLIDLDLLLAADMCTPVLDFELIWREQSGESGCRSFRLVSGGDSCYLRSICILLTINEETFFMSGWLAPCYKASLVTWTYSESCLSSSSKELLGVLGLFDTTKVLIKFFLASSCTIMLGLSISWRSRLLGTFLWWLWLDYLVPEAEL